MKKSTSILDVTTKDISRLLDLWERDETDIHALRWWAEDITKDLDWALFYAENGRSAVSDIIELFDMMYVFWPDKKHISALRKYLAEFEIDPNSATNFYDEVVAPNIRQGSERNLPE